uniref:Lipocalin/cytosolic fatty-acid binding domain-containing protein n=1 Tax=Pygocentrus nattereri TaxID=42514 RepID=A0A3B4EK74_PYGNA
HIRKIQHKIGHIMCVLQKDVLIFTNQQNFSGSWYRVGMAYESPSFIKYKDRALISKGFVVANENGSANLSMWTMTEPKICLSNFYIYEKTDVPGLFTYFSRRHKMMKDITVVEANYTDYAMVLKYRKMDKEYTQVALYVINHFESAQVFAGLASNSHFSLHPSHTPRVSS